MLDQLLIYVEEYGRKVEAYNGLRNHPLHGVGNLDLQPTDLERLQPEIDRTVEKLALLIREGNSLISKLDANVDLTFSGCGTLLKLVKQIEGAPDCSARTLKSFLSQDISGRLIDALKTGENFQAAKSDAETNFVDHAWVAEVSSLRADIVAGQSSFWSRLGASYRQAGKQLAAILKSPVPKKADDRLVLLDQLLLVQKFARDLKEEEDFLSARIGEDWRGQRTEFAGLRAGAEWARAVSQICRVTNYGNAISLAKNRAGNSRLKDILGQEASDLSNSCAEISQKLLFEFDKHDGPRDLQNIVLTEVHETLSRVAGSISEAYGEWTKIQLIGKNLEKYGLGELRTLIDVGELGAQKAKVELRYARAEALWKAALTPELNQFRTEDRGQDAQDFKTLEKERIKDTRREILAQHLGQLPSGSAGEMGVIRGEIGKRSRRLPVRQLMTRAASAIQRIKPVFLISPVSIAQFLPPEKFEFDILVIDEASQVRPEDALGAIARCKQIIVVGDQKQMPPSNFFSRLTDNADTDLGEEDDPLQGAARATEMESILSLAEARGVGGKPRMLTWHYRSKDPSLIRVSNEEFYDGELILPPSPVQNDEKFGLIFTKVNGIYHRGRSGKNINPIEAQAIVDRVAQHSRECPDLSLGIATLSKVQQTHINELLEFTRRKDPRLDKFLREGKAEDLFVKNLENIQGDERDVVLISICYGPAEAGGRLPSMDFGPVNKDGGERRLNVLFTRARVRCEVFCSFEPGDIDPRRTKNRGPVVLKHYLDFAKTGISREERVTGLGPDSPLEEDIAKVIRDLGYEVDYQVGSAGFRLDLAVRDKLHSGQYILAVECDGATYHSALWARERDRLRQAVLEDLGWRFHRIWSTDWFYNRKIEIERLTKALIDAAENAREGLTPTGVNAELQAEFDKRAAEDLDENTLEGTSPLDDIPVKKRPLYETFDISEKITGVEPHNYQLPLLADLTYRIVECEGPVHEVEVARRVAEKFGKERTGNRILGAVKRALSSMRLSGANKLLSFDQFWYTPQQLEDPPVRDRSNLTGPILKTEMLPPIEIQKAAELAIEENGHVEGDQLAKAIATMFGFKRIGPDLKQAISAVIDEPDER